MKVNTLNEQFVSVFNKDEDTSTIPDMGPSLHPSMDNISVTEAGVYNLLSNFQVHKAMGPDEIPTRLLKELAKELIVYLTPIFTLFYQACLDQGTIPDDWITANAIPIFKKGDRNKPENYRSVSLTTNACKTLEHIVCSSTQRHLEAHIILTDAQHGFRKRRSCETQLITNIQVLAKMVYNRVQTDVKLLDFSKAFDQDPHHRLLHKLQFYGIRGSLHSWNKSFLMEFHPQKCQCLHITSQVSIQYT